ncbi:HipA domain-containing protein [Pedobacter sp. CFBP9032]|uniref:type II toxin-antitoxin system HipA family toxin n=1 Tax=Pedobacter sp. CFBP9032 TaxID=3096539 RepID=UPI002A6A323D|nr:HipA domain-containing protein [Pedobacter sp. CFBP9032]MDY0904655.1 HipA domain-containing protein [Pedobacter sp. CFBP9032]
MKIINDPGTLAEGFDTYSPLARRRLFGGREVSHVLPYAAPGKDDRDAEIFLENRKRISISGVQEKLSVLRFGKELRLTRQGEQGTYILKPIPRDIKMPEQVPANEHLTMQIAKQVYGIATAENALVFFKGGEPAYITLRFDVRPDGTKWRMEDFASLAGKVGNDGNADYKYDYNYESLAALIRQFVPAWRVEIEKFFRLVVFNYLFSNGDAHLKNFSIIETRQGDFILSPAYDLLNTKIHVNDSDFGLNGGLFADGYKSAYQMTQGHVAGSDFIEFGRRIGIQEKRIEKLLAPFRERSELVESLTDRSFLESSQKKTYLFDYNRKRKLLNK